MRFSGLLFLALSLPLSLLAAATPTELLSRVPLRFEPNRGQVRASEPVAWTARSPEAAYAFTADGALIRTRSQMVRVRMQGVDPKAAYRPDEAFAAPTSYFTAAYRGNIPGYQRLRRPAIYPGIDLVYYGSGTRLEYDFEVAPGADPARVKLSFEALSFEGGASRVPTRLDAAGNLLIGAGADQGTLMQRAPVIYQILANGKHQPVQGSYRLASDGTVTLALGKYDRSARLVIDPTIVYTQYFFGTSADTAIAVTHDAQGFIYIAGNTQSPDFFIQGNFGISGNAGGQDAWVMKVNPGAPDGNLVPFSTYYGGSLNEIVQGIAVDAHGIAYITGSTTSVNIPTTAGAYATTLPGQTSTFIAAFDTNQAIQTYGTYLGGTLIDNVAGIALFNGRVYVTGTTSSPAFPTTAGAIESVPRGGTEVFVAEIDPSKSGTAALVASTYLPGSADDLARAITVDSAGMVYVAGETGSPDMPVTANAAQSVYDAGGDGFVIELNLQTMQVLYGTYVGGSGYDEIRSVMVEPGGHIGVVGYTLSTDLPATQNAFQTALNGYAAAFLAIVDPAAKPGSAPVYCTYFGGSFAEIAYGAALDSKGLYYLAGYTLSPDLPLGTTPALSPVSAGGGIDGFIAQIDPTKGLNGLIYSSYVTGLGSQLVSGIDVDANGVVYAVGWATSDIFPPGQAPKLTNPGDLDGFLLEFHP
jgi:hypothetical protein